jgi:hypothetical protein
MNINRNNYENFFLLYLDRELNQTDKLAVEKFLSENSDLQKEFTLLQQTILIPEQITFEPKELLFHKEEKRKVFPLYWVRIAAAVLVLLMSGWFVLRMNIQSEKNPGNNNLKNTSQATIKTKSIVNNKDQIVLMKVIAVTDNKRSGDVFIQKKKLQKPKNVLEDVKANVAENHNGNNERIAGGEFPIAAQKSSAALEIQNDNRLMTDVSKPQPSIDGTTAAVLTVIPVAGNGFTNQEHPDVKESEHQTDNAISVIALDDNNKSITGFFKKLTKTNPDKNKTTATRKIQVSVFQFSY